MRIENPILPHTPRPTAGASAHAAGGVHLRSGIARPPAHPTGHSLVSFTGHLRCRHTDAAIHQFGPESFDLCFTRFGVMFFADPVAAFRNIRRGMKSNGRLLLAVFRSASENPWATACVVAIRHLVPPPPTLGPGDPGQFSWSDPARVRRILDGAGFANVVMTPLDLSFSLGANAVEAAHFTTFIGQGARLLYGQPDGTREAARVALEGFFKEYEGQGGVSLPGALWFVSARA